MVIVNNAIFVISDYYFNNLQHSLILKGV